MSEITKQNLNDSLNDAWLRGMVESTLMLNPRLSKYEISVGVEQQIVTLAGEVNHVVDEWLSLELVKGFNIVKKVVNKLSIVDAVKVFNPTINLSSRNSYLEWYKDLNLVAEVKSKLGWIAALSGKEIEVQIINSKVVLNGEVDYESNKAAAELIVSKINSIKEIQNNITIKS